MVSVAVHATVDEIGTATGDDLAATYIHGNAHHAMRRHPTGRGNHRGHLGPSSLGVKVGTATTLPIQMGIGVVGVCSATEKK